MHEESRCRVLVRYLQVATWVLFLAGCSRPQRSLASITADVLPSRNGVLLILDLGDCLISADALAQFGRLDSIPGFEVQGILLQAPQAIPDLEALIKSFEIGFPVTSRPTWEWEAVLAHEQLTPPVAVLKRGGRVEAIFAGPRFGSVTTHIRLPEDYSVAVGASVAPIGRDE